MCVSISNYGYRLLVMLDRDSLGKMAADWYAADPDNEAFSKVLDDGYEDVDDSKLVMKIHYRKPQCDESGRMVWDDQRKLAANREFVEAMLNEYIPDLRESDVIEFSSCYWSSTVNIWREGCWF